ncbi:MAG: bifunctional ornithine acetyltransferase/N-acetylglutamate synthase, partial [Bryobacteraceae bacterium]
MNLPLGYKYATTYAGIRKDKRDDLALIVSAVPAAAAVAFTQNRVQAAPVTVGRKHLARSGSRLGAILINAGNANCATRTGERVALDCCRAAARALRMPIEQVMPSSTGVIGVELDAKLIVNALPRLVQNLSEDRFEQVAHAIMTTDTVPKTASAAVETSRGVVRIAGLTKGAGMIQPLMATTLGYVMTDANIAPAKLRPMMTRLVERSYNRLSVDGDTSTNDTLALLANGTSGVAVR